MGERGNYLCLAQKHIRSISSTPLMPFAELSYTMQQSTHGVTGINGKISICEDNPLTAYRNRVLLVRVYEICVWRTKWIKLFFCEIFKGYFPLPPFIPVLSAREKEGNHLPLFFRALHTAGNRGTVRTLPEYGVASHTQCLANAAWRNGGAVPWVAYFSPMTR